MLRQYTVFVSDQLNLKNDSTSWCFFDDGNKGGETRKPLCVLAKGPMGCKIYTGPTEQNNQRPSSFLTIRERLAALLALLLWRNNRECFAVWLCLGLWQSSCCLTKPHTQKPPRKSCCEQLIGILKIFWAFLWLCVLLQHESAHLFPQTMP